MSCAHLKVKQLKFFEALNPLFNTYVLGNAPVKQIATGFDWVEGPVDSAFDGEYKTTYALGNYSGNDFQQHFTVAITEGGIAQNYSIRVNVININPTKQWARIRAQIDDLLQLEYKVLPLS